MKFGLVVFPNMAINEIVEWCQIAEDSGFEYLWMPDESPSPGYKDIFVLLCIIAMKTKNIALGTSIFNPYTRHPAIVINGILSIAELTKTRKIVYGIGAGGILTLGPLGIKMWESPLTTVKDTILVARELLTGKHVNTENKFFKIVNLAFPLPKTEIPIYVAARGNKMLSLAGEYGDGVLLTTPVNYLETSVSMVKKSAESKGRRLEDIDIANWMPLGIDTNRTAARESVKSTVALLISFLPSYMIESAKVNEEKTGLIRELVRKNKNSEAVELVDDEMIDQFGIAGTPEEVIEKIKTMERKGLTHIMVGDPFGPEPKKAISLFGKEVIPAFGQ